MERQKIGILHPGNMGISVAASALNSGCAVYWASEGRSRETHERAARFDLRDAGTLRDLCAICTLVISVCPPHAAEEVAHQVLGLGYRGLYLDANAISPQRVIRIGQAMSEAGVRFVDGGIIGGPAWEPAQTWLHLSGEQAETVAACFSAGPLETNVLGPKIGPGIGKASALKMCYAAYTKGTTALLAAILATAEVLCVREELQEQWEHHWPGFPAQSGERVRRVTAKAWRFAGEMDEISSTFAGAGLPGGFHAAAATLYRRIAHYKGAATAPGLEEVLADLAKADD
jgi:3-hydroxyisobutyrate dehydrogenase-like beta-hydroxyacid dehydrogenase